MKVPSADWHVRPACPSDAEPLLRVLCAAFGLDCEAARPLFYQDPYFDLSLKWVLATPQHGIVACLTVIPATLLVRGVPLRTGGIAGVATYPHHQRQGYASHLLSETVRTFAAGLRFPLSALFPYSDTFYRRLGWETAARTRRWTGTLAPGLDEALLQHFRPVCLETPQDKESLRELRAMLPTSQTGLCRRDDKRWRVLEMTTGAWEWHVFEAQDICSGSVAIERSSPPPAPIIIHEMLAATDDARRGLLAFLSGLSQGCTPLSWATGQGRPAAFGLPAEGPGEAVDPGMMLRLVDLAAAARALHPALAPVLARTNRTLTIMASDMLCPQNNAPLRLTPHGVVAGSAGDPDLLRAPISAFAPIFSGDCLPSELAAQGQLQASSPDALSLADTLFPLTHPFIAPADQF